MQLAPLDSNKSKDPRCLHTAAEMWMSTMQIVWGSVPIDDTRSAKIGLQGSLREIASTEEELKTELDAIVDKIRSTQRQSRSMERLKPMLLQCRKLKTRLLALHRKRDVLQNHMETLENSELNQHVLYSMQRTSNALKAMGLDKSLQSVDKVMLELEENHNDVNSMQQTLGVGYADDDDVDWGLELNMLLSDDCALPPDVANSMPPAPAPAPVAVAVVRAPAAPAPVAVPALEPPAAAERGTEWSELAVGT
jgi:hypothetical protein